jgi:hypothetical protein
MHMVPASERGATFVGRVGLKNFDCNTRRKTGLVDASKHGDLVTGRANLPPHIVPRMGDAPMRISSSSQRLESHPIVPVPSPANSRTDIYP